MELESVRTVIQVMGMAARQQFITYHIENNVQANGRSHITVEIYNAFVKCKRISLN